MTDYDRSSEAEFCAKEDSKKYHREIKGVVVDIYDVLQGFDIACPATQHAVKKILCAGSRGVKNSNQDIDEAIWSLQRAKELNQ